MKASKITFLLFTVAIFIMSSCSNIESGDKLLKDKIKTEEIMASISGDSAMTEEMLNHLILNNSANRQLRDRIKSIINKEFLVGLMKDDSVLTNEVMCSVMEMAEMNKSVCQQMKQTIELYDLPNKLGLEWIDKSIVEKDKVKVPLPIIIPSPKKSSP